MERRRKLGWAEEGGKGGGRNRGRRRKGSLPQIIYGVPRKLQKKYFELCLQNEDAVFFFVLNVK